MTNKFIELADEAAAHSDLHVIEHEDQLLISRLEQAVRELVREHNDVSDSCTDWHSAADLFQEQRDKARAEVERLQDVNFKLGNTISKMNNEWIDDLKKMRSEIDRLKK